MSTTPQPAASAAAVALAAPTTDRLPAVVRPRQDQEADAIAKARAARDRILAAKFPKDALYSETMINLRLAIGHGWPSEAQFADAVGIDKFYLSKCWVPKGGGRPAREMGVGMYSRICLALGLLSNEEVTDEQLLMRSSLREYLVVNNNALMRTTVALTTLG